MNRKPKTVYTKTGLLIVTIMLVFLFWGFSRPIFEPVSFLGKLNQHWYGKALYVLGLTLLFIVIGSLAEKMGYPIMVDENRDDD